MPGIVIDAMQHRLAAADVIRDVLDIGGAADAGCHVEARDLDADAVVLLELVGGRHDLDGVFVDLAGHRSEEHTSELQSLRHLVCRLLLEKKNNKKYSTL